jgi:hypothetical protein
MTVSYLKTHGGKAERKGGSWNLYWPDGETYFDVVFTGKEAEDIPTARHLTLEDPKVRGLAMRLPRFAPGQPVPSVSIPGIAHEIEGFWSLWRITHLRVEPSTCPVPGHNAVYTPTARHIWDQLWRYQ